MKLNIFRIYKLFSIEQNKKLIVLIFFLIGLSKLLIIITPIIFGKLIDMLSNIDTNFLFVSTPIALTILYSISWLLSKILYVIQEYFFSFLYQKIYKKVMVNSLMHIHNMPYDFFIKNNSGNIIQRMRLGVRGFDVIFSSVIFTFIPTLIEFIFILVVFLYYSFNSLYLLGLLLTICIYYIITLYLTKSRLKAVRLLNTEEIKLYTSFSDNLSNFEAIKLYNKQEFLGNEYETQLSKYKIAALNVTSQMCKLKIIQDIILGVILLIFFIITILEYQNDVISIGQLVMCINYLLLLFTPIETLALEQDTIQQSLVDMEEFFSLLNEQIENNKNLPTIQITKGKIVFNSVTFFYKKSKCAIDNLSFTINENTINAIVGYSGSGKSTIAKLIERFYVYDKGNILIDEQEIKSYSPDSVRNNIAYVSQDIVLFNNTIKFNIAYPNNNVASDEEIHKVAKLAKIHDFIIKLPKGYNTIVGERGAQLSAGERQRIALARILIKKPKILIFDEITSSLDNYNKTQIEKTIKNLKGSCTIIIISHNLSFIQELDHIILIDSGKLVAVGNHNELLKTSKLYRSLYAKK